MESFFFISAGFLAYIFVGYPVLVFVISLVVRRKIHKRPLVVPVSLIISAYNEELVIRKKIENTLSLAYPKELLEIIVVSDGSTDTTDAIVREFGNKVKLLRVEGRRGKTHCQNRAAEIASGDILVFSDANSMYHSNALTELIANFSDSKIGMVYGTLRYAAHVDTEEPLYWNFETFLKVRESMLGTCVGVNGAMYAVRKDTFIPPDDTVQADLVEPFLQNKQGYRTVYEPAAFCTEVPVSSRFEYYRKIRIVHGALVSLRVIRSFLNPLRHGWYTVALWSHKIIRWYMFVLLLCAWISSMFLLAHPFFFSMFVLQTIFYGLAFLGRFLSGKIFSIPYYFVMVNCACAVAVWRTLRGVSVNVWETVRS